MKTGIRLFLLLAAKPKIFLYAAKLFPQFCAYHSHSEFLSSENFRKCR